MTRLWIAAAFLVVGLVLAGLSLHNGQPLVALTLALAGVYAAAGVAFGVSQALNSPTFQLAAGAVGLIGLVSVFLYNRAFDVNLQSAYAGALYEMGTLELRCRPMSPELADIQRFGVAACASQGNSDQMGAVVELGKGLHFGPTLSLADSAIGATKSEPPNYCAQAAQAASQLCPNAFISMTADERRALADAAK